MSSTGIGSPSAAIAVEELARVGAETCIRVGSCGGIQPEIALGDLVITTGAVRQEGTTSEYVREDYTAVADDRVVAALVTAAERLGHVYHLGLTVTTDAFYAGQARRGLNGYEAPGIEDMLEQLRASNVKNIEMEASAVLTLANLYGLRGGAVCTVFADRTTGEFRTVGEARAAETASLAAAILESMDERVTESDADRWNPGLGPICFPIRAASELEAFDQLFLALTGVDRHDADMVLESGPVQLTFQEGIDLVDARGVSHLDFDEHGRRIAVREPDVLDRLAGQCIDAAAALLVGDPGAATLHVEGVRDPNHARFQGQRVLGGMVTEDSVKDFTLHPNRLGRIIEPGEDPIQDIRRQGDRVVDVLVPVHDVADVVELGG